MTDVCQVICSIRPGVTAEAAEAYYEAARDYYFGNASEAEIDPEILSDITLMKTMYLYYLTLNS